MSINLIVQAIWYIHWCIIRLRSIDCGRSRTDVDDEKVDFCAHKREGVTTSLHFLFISSLPLKFKGIFNNAACFPRLPPSIFNSWWNLWQLPHAWFTHTYTALSLVYIMECTYRISKLSAVQRMWVGLNESIISFTYTDYRRPSEWCEWTWCKIERTLLCMCRSTQFRDWCWRNFRWPNSPLV